MLFYSDELTLLSREVHYARKTQSTSWTTFWRRKKELFYSDEWSLLSWEGFIMQEKHNRPAEPHSKGETKSYSTQMNWHYYQGKFIMLEKHNRPAEPHSEGEKKSYSTQMNGHYYHGRGSLCKKSTIDQLNHILKKKSRVILLRWIDIIIKGGSLC